MKKILFCLLILFSSCKYKHFQFDHVEHYRINFSDEKIRELNNKTNKTAEERRLDSILNESYFYEISKDFLNSLDKSYWIKRDVSKNKLSELEQIYYDGFNFARSKCIPVYRDILVFKQADSILGVSKICFECELQQTIDHYGDQKKFDNNDFEKLKQILE